MNEIPITSDSVSRSTHSDENAPLDISRKGQDKIAQNFRGQSFPKQNDGRSFQPSWIEKFIWIEYSKQTDKVYCYACRQYGLGNANDVFSTDGYKGWKRALSAGQGFQKHEASSYHINSMLSWKEKQSRTSQNQTISTLLNETVLEKRRYYFKAIIGTILFLVKNELPFRGDWNSDENKELGMFNSLFMYTIEKDKQLQHCQEAMPANALYTSPRIQNEIIQIIADSLRKTIVKELNNSTYVTLMADGTRDRNGEEIISIAFRYLKDGMPIETLVSFEVADDMTAISLSELIIDRIKMLEINDEKIISQCYDGAFVMSGHRGGVQKLLERHFNRMIPYVHCFNHRLHLVVEAVVEKIDACRMFFGEVKMLHNFFSRFKVRREYTGTNIPRLIGIRWSGHLYAVKSINKNYTEIVSTVEKIKIGTDRKFLPEDMALATGILNSIKNRTFVFMLYSLDQLLSTIEPANQILQRRDVGFRQAMPIIEAVFESVELLRSDEIFDRLVKLTDERLTALEAESLPTPRRIRHRSTRLNDSVVMDSLGERQSEVDNGKFKSMYFEVIDYVLSEMRRRFQNNNNILLAISELNNINSNKFDQNSLGPLEEIGLVLPSESELQVVKTFLAKEMEKPENEHKTILKILLPVKDAFPIIYRLFEAAESFGSSTSINECSFSALARIDTVRRMSMSDQRLLNLSFLAFENKRLTLLDEDDIVRKFAEKNRRIQLY